MKWIDVKDKLPKRLNHVLFFDSLDNDYIVGYWTGEWWISDHIDYVFTSVTYWMPLPEEPLK
jgi:hypothetical protein